MKLQSRKNLFEIKQKLLSKSKNEKNNEIPISNIIININTEKINIKIQKIKFEALAYKEKGDIDNYEKKLIEGLSLEASNMEFLKLLGDLYFNIGKITKALPLLKKIIEVDINDHKTIWEIGHIYYEKGDIQTAKLLVEKAIQLNPENPKYFVTLAELMYNSENIQKSILLMERAIKLRPTNINYLLATGSLYEDIGETQNAKKYYFKVLELEPTNDVAKKKLSTI